jgi:hypothetical protein
MPINSATDGAPNCTPAPTIRSKPRASGWQLSELVVDGHLYGAVQRAVGTACAASIIGCGVCEELFDRVAVPVIAQPASFGGRHIIRWACD